MAGSPPSTRLSATAVRLAWYATRGSIGKSRERRGEEKEKEGKWSIYTVGIFMTSRRLHFHAEFRKSLHIRYIVHNRKETGKE